MPCPLTRPIPLQPAPTECVVRAQASQLLGRATALIVCDWGAAAADARVLQSALAMALLKPVLVLGEFEDSDPKVMRLLHGQDDIAVGTTHCATQTQPAYFCCLHLYRDAAICAVLLLTENVLADTVAMRAAAEAARFDHLLVPVLLSSRGYSYEKAVPALRELQLPGFAAAELDPMRNKLLEVLPNTIAVDWRPEGGANGTAAAANEIVGRINGRPRTQRRRSSSSSKGSNRGKSKSKLTATETGDVPGPIPGTEPSSASSCASAPPPPLMTSSGEEGSASVSSPVRQHIQGTQRPSAGPPSSEPSTSSRDFKPFERSPGWSESSKQSRSGKNAEICVSAGKPFQQGSPSAREWPKSSTERELKLTTL